MVQETRFSVNVTDYLETIRVDHEVNRARYQVMNRMRTSEEEVVSGLLYEVPYMVYFDGS